MVSPALFWGSEVASCCREDDACHVGSRWPALGRAAAWVSLPALLGPILGPLVDGAIITNHSWRFMFWVNVPFCGAGLIVAGLYLAKDTPSASAEVAAA